MIGPTTMGRVRVTSFREAQYSIRERKYPAACVGPFGSSNRYCRNELEAELVAH